MPPPIIPIGPVKLATVFEPRDPVKFARDFAGRINQLMKDPALCRKFGEAGRKRAEEKFGWPAIARQTKALYEQVTTGNFEF